MSLMKPLEMTERATPGASARRVRDANRREVRKLTNLLLKLKLEGCLTPTREAAEEPPEGDDSVENPLVSHDVSDN